MSKKNKNKFNKKDIRKNTENRTIIESSSRDLQCYNGSISSKDTYNEKYEMAGNITEEEEPEYQSEEIYESEVYDSEVYDSQKEIDSSKDNKSILKQLSVLIILLVVYFSGNMVYKIFSFVVYRKTSFTTKYIKENPVPSDILPYIDEVQFEKALLTSDFVTTDRTLNYLYNKREEINAYYKSVKKSKSGGELALDYDEYRINDAKISDRITRLEKRKSKIVINIDSELLKRYNSMTEDELRKEVDNIVVKLSNGQNEIKINSDYYYKVIEELIGISVMKNYEKLLADILTKIVDKTNYINKYFSQAKLAIQINHMDCLKLFINHKLDLNHFEGPENLIHIATMFGNIEIVKYLLDAGVPIDQWNSTKDTALTLAIKTDRIDIVEYLLSKGALTKRELDIYNNPDTNYCSYEFILFFPVKNNNYKMLELLVNNGVSVNEELKYLTNNRKILLFLMEKLGKNYNDEKQKEENEEWKEVNDFIVNGQLDKLKSLENNGKDLSKMYYDGEPAVCIAVNNNRKEIVEYLVKKYDCKNQVERIYGRNALHCASICSETEIEMLNCLIENGFDPNGLDFEKNTALNYAVCNKDNRFIEALIESGADPTILNSNNKNSLSFFDCFFKTKDNEKLFNLLVKKVEKSLQLNYYNKKNLKKQTPLHLAILSNNSILVNYYLEHGADPNAQDLDGNTALHYVAKYAPTEKMTIPFFVFNYKYKLDFTIKNKEGKTPLDICNTDCFKIFRIKKYKK